MPSGGSVTKKVALFELSTDGKSQLKRKHAIKRKNRNNNNNGSQSRPYSSAEILSDTFSDDGHTRPNSIANYGEKLCEKENHCDTVKSKSSALTTKQDAKLVSKSDFPLERERTFKERVNGVSKDVLHADVVQDKNNSAKSQSFYGTKKRHDIKTVSLNTVFLFSGSFTALDALEFDGKSDNTTVPHENTGDCIRSTEVVSSSKHGPKLALWSPGEDVHPRADGGEFILRRSASVDSVFQKKSVIVDRDNDEDEEPFYEELDTIYNQFPDKAHTLDRMPTNVAQTFRDSSGQNETVRQRLSQVHNQAAVGAYQVTSLFKDEDETQLTLLQTSSPSYESLYSELIYDNGSHSGKSGKDLSLPLPPPPLSAYSDVDGSYNNSNSSFEHSSSSNYSTKTADRRSNGEVYGFRTLPPPPPPSSSVHGARKTSKIIAEAPNKFSSMAKTAGRKIAKKLLSMRRPSQSSFDIDSSSIRNKYQGAQVPMRRASSPCPSVASSAVHSSRFSDSGSTTGSTTGSRSALLPRRSLPTGRTAISRPPVPPPAPPTILPPSSPPPVPPTIFVNNINGLERLNGSNKDGESKYGQTSPQNEQRISSDFDDYEDSDFYDSDSELIRNFVSAVQPIYSMEEEPLYQYYTYGISLKPEDDYQPVIPKNLGLTLDLLVPRVGQRTLWCELPEVISSGILSILSDKQKQWQEAIFEILTSEVSYLKSLDVLISLFYESQDLCCILTAEEMKCIYGNITQVKACSQAFLSELLSKWEESWYIQEIGQTVNDYALNKFLPYVEYCRNKPYQDKMLQKLRLTNDDFVSAVKRIEENPKCQMLRMDSFLMLPMQRITRLPLLVNAVIQRTQSLKEKASCEEALASLTNLVLECNEAARESQDAEETAAIIEKIEFPRYLKNSVTLGQFVMKNDFMKNPLEGNNQGGSSSQLNWTFRKSKRTLYWLILFSNQLLVTKKKSSGKFEVMEAVPTKDCHIKPLPNIDGVSKDFNHFFMLHFDNRETVHFLGAKTQSEVERWRQKLDSLRGAAATKEKVYQVIFAYEAQRDDELSLEVGEKIHVSQMQPDGWYFGAKVSNSKENGWFPGNYCNECS